MIKIRKELIIAFITVIVIIPVIINFLLLTKIPLQYAADAKTWLTFWGSYLGGVIAVCSAYFIFRRQLDVDAKRKEYEVRLAEYNSLSRDLGELCSLMWSGTTFIRLINANELEKVNAELSNGIEKGKRLKYELNGFLIKYHPQNDAGVEFVNSCKGFQKYFSEVLTKTCLILGANANTQKKLDNDWLKNFSALEDYQKTCKKTDEIYELAFAWIEKERKMVDKIHIEYLDMLK